MTSGDMAHIDRVSKSFGGVEALKEMDIRLARGEFVTFLGPSGCGKTTTLRLLGGFETPTSGRIVIGGLDVTHLPPNRRRVNMVFQDYALFPHMNVGRNVAFGLELKGMSRSEIVARSAEILDFLELTPLVSRFPDELSGGQRQRVALARALAPDPDVLLLDEPLSALDARLRSQVQSELKAIQRRTGKTFFFVTHDQDEALTMSDRIVVMNHGVIKQVGTPHDLYHRPQTRFVAEFIGETNMLEGTYRGRDGAFGRFDWHGQSLFGRAPEEPAADGSALGASVRLEDVHLTVERPDLANALRVRLLARTFKGNHHVLDLACEDAGGHPLSALVVHADAASIEPGQMLWAGWSESALTILAS